MTEYFIGNLMTGRRLQSLPVLRGPWDDRLHVAETIGVTVDLNDPDVQALGLRNSATPAQAFLAVVENQTVMAAGPIWTRDYDRPNRTLELGAAGLASLWDHRMILPILAASIGVDQFTIPDPLDATKTIPNPALSTALLGMSLGTIAKRLVQQARTWTGGNVPVVFQADEFVTDPTGAHDRTYIGANFKPVWEAIQDLMNVIGGPEVNFLPRFTSDNLGIEWLMQTGTEAQPLITSPSVLAWDLTVPESPISDFSIHEDASGMGSLAWQTGGSQNSMVLVARAYDATLVNANFPLLEKVDTSHSSVSVQGTLDGYAASDVLAGRTTNEVWSFTVRAYPVADSDGAPSAPTVGDYTVGDFCDIFIAPYDPATGMNDPYLTEGGTFRMRIIGISGDEQGEEIKLSLAPLVKS